LSALGSVSALPREQLSDLCANSLAARGVDVVLRLRKAPAT
jgi:hypothetical protein